MRLRIGTRGSHLALWQAQRVVDLLARVQPQVDAEIVVVESHGDRDRHSGLGELGTVGIFTREIEAALLDGRTDVAVHSLKDMPTQSPDGLRVAAVLERDDPRDVLVAPSLLDTAKEGADVIAQLPKRARVGTSSLRRQAELLRHRHDLRVYNVRGNVPTRLDKVASGEFDAIVLSLAGLTRLGLQPEGAVPLSFEQMLPAPAQGTIAVQVRADDGRVAACIAPLDHAHTRLTTDTERLLLQHLEGGCRIPLGAHATLQDGMLTLRGRLTRPDGSEVLDANDTAPEEAWRDLAARVAEQLRQRGAGALLRAARGL